MASGPYHTGEWRGYALIMRILHWLMAVLVILMIAAGIYMVNGDWGGKFPPSRGWFYDFHRGTGFLLLVLVVIRLLVYRFTEPPSPLPAGVSPVQKFLADLVHFLLYTLLIVQPLFGWYATNTWGVKDISVFGLFNLPAIAEKNRELGNQLLEIHGLLGIVMAILVLMHVGAALAHQLLFKDDVMSRMLRTKQKQ